MNYPEHILYDCRLIVKRSDGTNFGTCPSLDFVKAFHHLDALSRATGKEEVPVDTIIPPFQDFLAKELGTEQVSFGEAFQIYDLVVKNFTELKKKLSDVS